LFDAFENFAGGFAVDIEVSWCVVLPSLDLTVLPERIERADRA